MITQYYCHYWEQVASRLLPLEEGSSESRIPRLLPLVYQLPIALLMSGTAGVRSILSLANDIFCPEERGNPKEDFSLVLKDSRYWKQIEPLEETLQLEERHLIGPATCTYQDSGLDHCPNSQWADYEKRRVPESEQSKSSANLYELYKTPEGRKEVIERLQKLGANSYRFSVEWSQIEPKKGEYNEEALQVYVDLCKSLRDANIRPVVTFLHFSEPYWWHLEGSFENDENVIPFISFCSYVYKALTVDYQDKPLVDIFCTINEPAIDAFSRYIRGAFPPEVMGDFKRAAHFLHGALKAHQAVYQALKRDDVEIGITHQRLSFKPKYGIVTPATHYLTHFVNEVSLEYFRSGKFDVKVPLVCNISIQDEKPTTDFVGLQYYVRPLIGFGSVSYYEEMTMMPFREDAEGIYEAMLEVYDAYQKPIFITENGISTNDEAQRYRYMERSLYSIQRAIDQIGKENFMGYLVWSFCKNMEWDMKMDPQDFGAFPLNRNELGTWNLAKEPRLGIQPLIKIAKAWQERYGAKDEVREVA